MKNEIQIEATQLDVMILSRCLSGQPNTPMKKPTIQNFARARFSASITLSF